jgi:acetyl coenzyme A synthetase (ADP forming)-like protein
MDGTTVRIRVVDRGDAPLIERFYESLSAQARRLGAYAREDLGRKAEHWASIGEHGGLGLVAVRGKDQQVVAHAVYEPKSAASAEVTMAIRQGATGQGIGSILLGQLAQAAADRHITCFEAHLASDDTEPRELLRASGFAPEVEVTHDGLRIRLPTVLSDRVLAELDRRESSGAANALRHFLQPSAIAVIGASRRRGTVGGEVFHNLIAGGFHGPVYPVNASATVVQSVAAYRSVVEVPGPVELAIIAVPCEQVPSAIAACERKGVSALVVLSAGFAETGLPGRARQVELLRQARDGSMRLIGPNCLGIINTADGVAMNATFGPVVPVAGSIGFMSQSGALGLVATDYAKSLGLGISSFVSVGNKADISANDLLCYWEGDPRTDVILLYLESFGNPRRFSRIARRVGTSKPIVAVKSGRTTAGARAAGSHTGALLATSDVTVDALFRQAGVVRAETVEEQFEVASLLSSQPLPAGNTVAIVSNAGGPAILCADACEARGLKLPVLSDQVQSRLRELLPAAAGLANPVDMIASATAEQFHRTVTTVASDPSVNAIIVIFLQPLATRPEEVARAILMAQRDIGSSIPILTVFMSAQGAPGTLLQEGSRIPAYRFPESAAIALSHAARYAAWRRKPSSGPTVLGGIRREAAATIVADALNRGAGWLHADEVKQLLTCYGIATVDQRIAASPEQAASAGVDLPGQLVLKALAADVVHKTEAGLVRLRLDPDQVEAAAAEMVEQARARGTRIEGFLVQPMIDGVEMLAGVVQDPQFGPVVACGAGGIFVELIQDIAVGLAPLSIEDASEMVRSLRSYALLTGFRGAPPRDASAVEGVLLRLAALADHFPQIVELDCNPLMVQEHGAVVVDARARVATDRPTLPLGART